MRTCHSGVAAWVLCLVTGLPALPEEPATAAKVPVTAGLVLHVDARSQNAARAGRGLPLLRDGDSVGILMDAAGGPGFQQWSEPARPRYVEREGVAALEFDGKDDFLTMTTGLRTVAGMTAIVVAAPVSNPGGFRALFAATTPGANDYVAGCNIDLGPDATDAWTVINAEGAGFEGSRDLSTATLPFGELAVITMVAGGDAVHVHVNDTAPESRPREPAPIALEQCFLGARCYSHDAHAPAAGAFYGGWITEVLVYDRALDAGELAAVHSHLRDRHPLGQRSRAASAGHHLRVVDNPPEVQMLVPGFGVEALPVRLPNINNVLYRPDGKLVAGAYNGNVYLLTDTDGDGLEDDARLWWDSRGETQGPLGIALTPPGFAHGTGVIIASKGKVTLITDDDGDEIAESGRIIAQGWPEGRQAVDAVGVAVDPGDHSIYFGIGTALYNNAYLLDKDGRAHFDINGELGTIQRILPDLKSRETVCTGIRFSCALRFNEHGDLFATEQEGATWMPNGNPFDELLHIQRGRHYGFPPMHPRHLPGVIDEPSVIDYKPQHQSTCGLNFNVPVREGGPVFGPGWWRDDALVIGESRGKLWRSRLVKRPGGYLAQTQLIACLNRLAIDGCVSPDGGFVVCTHSGDPDWGTGPSGEGMLYKVRQVRPEVPQPVLAWAQGPGELRVAFDRPLDPGYLQRLNEDGAVKVEFGAHVSAGDRFEAMRPGYEVVRSQMRELRHDLPVRRVQVTGDRRTLIVLTDRQASQARRAIQLPGFQEGESIDVACSAEGVETRLVSGDTRWDGWLPHPDLKASEAMTRGSADHDRLWKLLEQGGLLTMAASLQLDNMLRPAVQPGSSIDFEYPAETVTLTAASPGVVFQLRDADGGTLASSKGHTANMASIDLVEPERFAWMLSATVPATGSVPELALTWHTNEDSRQRVLPLERVQAPWAATEAEPQAGGQAEGKALAGASWLRGREIFFSDRAQCSKCHTLEAAADAIGPDLGNLVHRDLLSVTRDINDPSAAIHPDFVTYRVEMRDGSEHVGTLRFAGDKALVGTAAGVVTTLDRSAITATEPLPVSIMPPGLDKVLGEADFGHLLAFLTGERLQAAPIEREGAPEPRPLQQVERVLAAQAADDKAPAALKPLRILLCTGPKDHGPGEHDYPLWRQRWAKLLPLAEKVTVDLADPWPTGEQFARADVAVFYSANPGWNLRTARDLARFQERGGGVVIIHWAVHGGEAPEQFASHIGLSGIPTMRYRHGPLRLDFTTGDHPITRGFRVTDFVDESYWRMVGDPDQVRVLANSEEDGAAWPQLWTFERGRGRVFVSIPGHYTWTFDDPLFRILLLRGICWSAREPADRLSGLTTVGARVQQP